MTPPTALVRSTPITGASRIEDVSRRGLMIGALATALFVACGTDDEAAPQGATRTITHEFGTFEVPLSPQRIVALDGRPGFEATLALGFKPIAIGTDAVVDGKLAPFIDFDHRGVLLVNPNEVAFEDLARLAPDLIIGRDFQIKAQRDRLAAIAPILPIRFEDTWRAALVRLADWLDRRDHVDAQLARYDTRLAPVRERHASQIGSATVGILQYGPAESTFYSMHGVQRQTMLDLGGTEFPFLANLPSGKRSFSLEQVSQLDGIDAILLIGFENANELLRQERIWQRIPAVVAGRVVETDIRTTYGGLYAATACIDLFDRLYRTLA